MSFLNQTAEYAVRAILAIAALPHGNRAQAHSLAEELNIPKLYLSKILQVMAVRGVLSSTRGRGGGFWLAKPAEELHLIDVLRCFEMDPELNRCVIGLTTCDNEHPCALHKFWRATRESWMHQIESRSLRDLVESELD